MIDHLNWLIMFVVYLFSPELLWQEIDDGINSLNANTAWIRFLSIDNGNVIKSKCYIRCWDFQGNKWEYDID